MFLPVALIILQTWFRFQILFIFIFVYLSHDRRMCFCNLYIIYIRCCTGRDKGLFNFFFFYKNTYLTLTVCGSAVNNSLRSPGYPVTDYQSNMDCIYLVPIPHDMAMNISFKDFVIEDGLHDCEWVTLLCKLPTRIHLTREVINEV